MEVADCVLNLLEVDDCVSDLFPHLKSISVALFRQMVHYICFTWDSFQEIMLVLSMSRSRKERLIEIYSASKRQLWKGLRSHFVWLLANMLIQIPYPLGILKSPYRLSSEVDRAPTEELGCMSVGPVEDVRCVTMRTDCHSESWVQKGPRCPRILEEHFRMEVGQEENTERKGEKSYLTHWTLLL